MQVVTRASRARWVVVGLTAVLTVITLVGELVPTAAKANVVVERAELDSVVRRIADAGHTALAGARPAGAAPREPGPPASERYLAAVFGTLLEREPSAGEIATWRPAVEHGDLSSVTRAVSSSDEWAAVNVAALYRSALRREPDPAGKDLWVGRIRRGATLQQAAAALYGSGEYYATAGSSPEGFVDSLYRDLLGRPADPGGLVTWTRRLAAGTSRDSVAAALYGSGEARSRRVAERYDAVLERPADPGGEQFWTGRLRSGDDSSLVAALGSSGEFFRKATGDAPPPRPERGQATGFQPFARAGRVHLAHPSAVVDFVGFHQSSQPTAIPLQPSPLAVDPTVLWGRGRGTDRRSAADIVVPPNHQIRAPVTGTVVLGEAYRLYCKYADQRLAIVPDADPSVRVTVLHVTGVRVRPGDRVEAGKTVVADSANVLPFRSQVDALDPHAPWPHVHVEVNPGAVARAAAGGC